MVIGVPVAMLAQLVVYSLLAGGILTHSAGMQDVLRIVERVTISFMTPAHFIRILEVPLNSPEPYKSIEILAAEQTPDNPNWYQGTADAVRQAAAGRSVVAVEMAEARS